MADPWIFTYSGKRVNPLALKPNDIDIVDIAHSLSLENRFNGHTSWPLSVAAHSVAVSRLCDPEYALQGLLHDASEAYLGDVTKWLKATPAFEAYRHAEEAAQQAIFERFGCSRDLHESVEAADRLMVRVEVEVAHHRDHELFQVEGYGRVTIEERDVILSSGAWPQFIFHAQAEVEFLARFRDLATRGSK